MDKTIVGEESGDIIAFNLVELSLYDVIIENRSSRPLQGISPFVGSTRASDTISIRDMLTGVKDAERNSIFAGCVLNHRSACLKKKKRPARGYILAGLFW